MKIFVDMQLNSSQKSVVAHVSERVMSDDPELLLLHGPPGWKYAAHDYYRHKYFSSKILNTFDFRNRENTHDCWHASSIIVVQSQKT